MEITRKKICEGLNKIWDIHPELNFPEILKQYIIHPDSFVDGSIFTLEEDKLLNQITDVLSGKIGYLYDEKRNRKKETTIKLIDKKKGLYKINWIGI